MVKRVFWQKQIEAAWSKRSVIWLSGVRRVGKTRLCQSLENTEYLDCELPQVRQLFENSQFFFKQCSQKRLILDEIHRLNNPSEVLKIAADHFPDTKVIATGSSTLGASSKFADTLTGRKTELWLTPLLLEEMKDFGPHNLTHRLLHGGLPPFFMLETLPEQEFQEWISAYWGRDIQELFQLEKRYSFQKLTELLFTQSGSIFEATRFTAPCEVSRQTIMNYLAVLEATFVVHMVRPFTSYRPAEIVSAPKVYGFDTGFICYVNGWGNLRQEDKGLLWEHCILNELHARLQTRNIYYWRDKQKHEIDFIYFKRRSQSPIAIECKWNANKFSDEHLQIFRRHYPEGENYVVAPDIEFPYQKPFGDIIVNFVNSKHLIESLL